MLPEGLFVKLTGVWIVRRLLAIASLVALVAALGLVAGCGDSGDEEAQTPSSATTVANSAAQTDSEGQTVTAPDTNAPGDETGTAPAGTESTPAESTETAAAPPAGDVAAGKTFFAATCTGCHMADGTEAGGVGPKLAGLGLTSEFIHDMVVNGGQIMPPGLATGADLDNVVAYVESIQ